MKGIEKPIKGVLTYLNDSTLLLNDTPTAVADIEQIKVTTSARKKLGIVFTVLGGVVSLVN